MLTKIPGTNKFHQTQCLRRRCEAFSTLTQLMQNHKKAPTQQPRTGPVFLMRQFEFVGQQEP